MHCSLYVASGITLCMITFDTVHSAFHSCRKPIQAIARQSSAMRRSIHRMLQQLFSPVLRRTTLMLLFIWFSNAISYYGLVLLATTVRSSYLPFMLELRSHNRSGSRCCHICSSCPTGIYHPIIFHTAQERSPAVALVKQACSNCMAIGV